MFLRLMSKSILPMFSSKTFMVSGLTFRSLIHFVFIFVCSMTKCPNFILLHVAVQFSQHQLLKRLSFPHFFHLCYRLIINAQVYFWDFCSIPLIYVSVHVPIPYCFDYCSFIVQSKVRECDTSVLLFFLKIALTVEVFCSFL